MTTTHRLRKLLAALALPLFASAPSLAADVVQARLTVQADAAGPRIDPDIYGQFAEHLGAGIYDGLWVGAESKIPNIARLSQRRRRRRCANSACRWCAGRAAASPTTTTGATASATATQAPGAS